MSLKNRLSVPDGPLRKNRRRSRNVCPRKTAGCQLRAARNAEKRRKRTKLFLILGFRRFYISPYGTLPGALGSTNPSSRCPPRVCTSPEVSHVLEFKTSWLRNSITSSFFYPKHHSFFQ